MGEGQERVQGVERGEVVVDDAGEEVGGGGRGGCLGLLCGSYTGLYTLFYCSPCVFYLLCLIHILQISMEL